MKAHLKSFGVLLVAITLTSCGGGGGGSSSQPVATPPPPQTTTATMELYRNFNLPDILTKSQISPSGTNTTQITFRGSSYSVSTGFTDIILRLEGTFTIPSASLNAANANGTTGTVTAISQIFGTQTLWRVDGLSVSALEFTNAYSAGDWRVMWRLVANGATNVNGINRSTQSSSSLFCGVNATGASIGIPNTATSIKSFLVSC
jgi:hypothetical protein